MRPRYLFLFHYFLNPCFHLSVWSSCLLFRRLFLLMACALFCMPIHTHVWEFPSRPEKVSGPLDPELVIGEPAEDAGN